MEGARWRVVAIALLLLLSVVVDSTFYIVSACTDAMFIGAAVFLIWPVVKKIW